MDDEFYRAHLVDRTEYIMLLFEPTGSAVGVFYDIQSSEDLQFQELE